MGPQYVLTILTIFSVLLSASHAVATTCALVTNLNHAAPATNSITMSVATPVGSNFLAVMAGIRHTTATITGATHAGNAMTAVAAASALSPVTVRSFYIVNPTAGTNNIVVTYDNTPLADAAIVVSCTGVNTSSPIHDSTNASATSTAVSNTVPSIVSTDIVLDYFVQNLLASSPTVGANQTSLNAGSDGGELGWGGSQQAGTDGGAMTWTTALSAPWVSQAFAVSAAPSSVPLMMRRRSLQ